MTSDFPYYLAAFGLAFFLMVICCCVKLIDIIDRPRDRLNNTTMPAWNYANYLQSSPVAILSPQPESYLRYLVLAENRGMTIEEYLASTGRPSLYPSTSRAFIHSQASIKKHNVTANTAPIRDETNADSAPTSPHTPHGTPPLFTIHVPERDTNNPILTSSGHTMTPNHLSRSRDVPPPQYDEVVFDV